MTHLRPAVLCALLLAGCSGDLPAFRQTLAANQSATVALEQWCARQHIASPAAISAETLDDSADPANAPTDAIRRALAVSPEQPLRVRHVRLSCGGVVLSDARNWYVPARLTEAMNHTLDTTRTPFGKVVAPGGLHREPLPKGMASPASCPAGSIHHETAVLRRDDGAPISLVSECYTRANLRQK